MRAHREVPIIYNLFPRLAGRMSHWMHHAARAADMGFNWIYINSILYPGYSGSLYAVRHHYRINPMFLPRGARSDGMSILEHTLARLRDLGLCPIMDLVINHTSRDSPLIYEHPSWYLRGGHTELVSPYVRDIANPDKITVWEDLAEIDNKGSRDRDGLWSYWAELVKFYLRLGFKGFRCDTAYKVPQELWRYLVGEALSIDPEAVFFAETLGAVEEQTLALRGSGMHYFFNSSKWWDFEQPWCIPQHEMFSNLAPSISFPESHDTPRLAADTNGNEAVQRQRYAFAAVYSAGVMMPIGYEFGFKNDLEVAFTRPTHWEKPSFDIKKFIKRVNTLKCEHPLLWGEGHIKIAKSDASYIVLERRSEQVSGKAGWIIVNKRWDQSVSVALDNAVTSGPAHRLYRICRDDSLWEGEPILDRNLALSPAEVALILEPLATRTGEIVGTVRDELVEP